MLNLLISIHTKSALNFFKIDAVERMKNSMVARLKYPGAIYPPMGAGSTRINGYKKSRTHIGLNIDIHLGYIVFLFSIIMA